VANDEWTDALLADLRVVDLTDGYAALAGRVLADMGAEVVRVQVPGGGEGPRRAPRAADGTGLHHAFRNVGKLVVTLDPGIEADRATVDGLLAGADLAIVADGWGAALAGWSPAELSARHPHLVVSAVSPYGLDSPWADHRATELVAQGLAGVVYRSGVPELPPVSAPGSYCEDLGAVVAALAGIIGVHQAEVGGGGQVVDVAAVLALAQCTEMSLPLWSLLKMLPARNGAGLYPLFECSDGLARIVLPMSPGEWRSLIAWMGSPPEWTGPEWEQAMLGEAQRNEIMSRLPAMFAAGTRAEVTESGDAAGVRVTPVLTPAEVLTNEHCVARATFAPVDIAGATASVAAPLFGLSGARLPFRGPAREGRAPTWPARPAPAPRPAAEGLPLAGLRVLEIGSGIAAPEAARVLGEWGAEVIKVESRNRPDFQRMVMGGEMNPAFSTPARNKLSLGADLGTEAGRDLVHRMLPSIDIVVENNATGVIDRLGFGWEVLHAANPQLVLVGTQLYGNRGPLAARKGYGPSARAVGGLTWLWAHGADAPRGVMTIHPDHLAGRLVAMAALAGVRRAARTGEGCRVDLAQFEAVQFLLGDLLMAESLEPGAAVPVGNASAEHAPWGLFQGVDDADGAESWLAVCVTDDAGWAGLVELAGGAVPDREGWRTGAGRLADAPAVEASVAAWLRDLDLEQVEEGLQQAGVAAGLAAHPRIQASHPVFVGRGYPVAIDQPGSGPLILEGPAFQGSRMGTPRCGPAPAISEHSEQLCEQLLGMSRSDVDALVAAGALEPTPERHPEG
jgi:crotonobetainyl-CoA:carnitine CoA-transferase CaiB-like acyl-CoA transferase